MVNRTLCRTPSVLLYHGVPRTGRCGEVDAARFETQVLFLKRHFAFIHPDQVGTRRAFNARIQLLLTFDDGFRNNAEVVAPILRRNRVPAIFFISSRHVTPGKYLFSAYLAMLLRHFKANGFKLRGEFMDMRLNYRQGTLSRVTRWLSQLKPYPTALYRVLDEEMPRLEDFVSPDDMRNECAGMSEDQVQVRELARDPLFRVGAHTVDHPRLEECERTEAFCQITENKLWLERVSGQTCDTIAYPYGNYSRETIELCRLAGLDRGYAALQKFASDPDWEIPRIGIYSPSVDLLGFKVVWARALALDYWPRSLTSVIGKKERNCPLPGSVGIADETSASMRTNTSETFFE